LQGISPWREDQEECTAVAIIRHKEDRLERICRKFCAEAVSTGAMEVLRWFAAEVSPSLSVPISSVVMDSGPRLDHPALGGYAVFGGTCYHHPTKVGFPILGMQ
jgi:hypothetical protein